MIVAVSSEVCWPTITFVKHFFLTDLQVDDKSKIAWTFGTLKEGHRPNL